MFFPAAALYGAGALGASVLGLTGMARVPAAIASPSGHAHEMLLGYALAVIAGYQLPALPAPRLWGLFALWLLARLCFVALDRNAAGTALDAAFAVALALHAAPRLARSAKKLRNQALPALIVAICAAAFAYALVRPGGHAVSPAALETSLILLLAALMLFMGGRMLAPMVAGHFYRRGRSLGPRVQPRIEAALLATTAIAAAAAPFAELDPVLRFACIVAGSLGVVRMLRWRLWACAGRGDILRIASGYAWLAAGLLAIGATRAAVRVAALHLVTIGALGTLSFNVMARVAFAGMADEPRRGRWLTAGTLVIGAAAAMRYASASWPQWDRALLLGAAACWALAFVALSGLLVQAQRTRRRDRASRA